MRCWRRWRRKATGETTPPWKSARTATASSIRSMWSSGIRRLLCAGSLVHVCALFKTSRNWVQFSGEFSEEDGDGSSWRSDEALDGGHAVGGFDGVGRARGAQVDGN